MGRIAVLPEELINKIAAGEVVERPASVIKELVENAIDAGARTVRVTVRDGGLGSITVLDDGVGMSREDARLALERHATSKLRDVDGLFEILTKGFRGEAVPAIASVSRFTLVTGETGARVGTRVQLDGGQGLELGDAPPISGTRIEVHDLFFNTPARRKFMKRDQTELSHCEEAMVRLALAHPEVSFFLELDGRSVLASPACAEDPKERIAAALGAEVHPHLLEVEERHLGIRVYGFAASPEYTLPNARGLYTFVNRRYIRDRGLNHAVQRAYQEALPPGRQPVAVLFVELDPRAVDVNVHPQKLEVRFADPRGVHEAMVGAVGAALQRSPWLQKSGATATAPAQAAHYAQAVDRFLARAAGQSVEPLAIPFAAEGTHLGFGQLRPGINEAPPPGFFSDLRYLATLGKRFWLCEGRGASLVVVDPHAAVERVRRSELTAALERAPESQRLLFTAQVEVSEEAAGLLSEGLDALARLGLEVEPFGGNSFSLAAVPGAIEGTDYRALLEALAYALPAPGAPVEELSAAIEILACKAAARAPSEGEAVKIFAQLEKADFALACSCSKIVVQETPLLELERRAGSKN
jgi:DNA mismatch repair protein MutL